MIPNQRTYDTATYDAALRTDRPLPGEVSGNGAGRLPAGSRPHYVAVGDEQQVFAAAYEQGLSILLKGPTGCGKTRFVEAMAHDLGRPLITVACHDDLTTADLVGRFLLRGGVTEWVDGPLTCAVREGAICYRQHRLPDLRGRVHDRQANRDRHLRGLPLALPRRESL